MQRTFAKSWSDYELLDAGNSKKLERWGNVITIRPDRNAFFKPAWSFDEWKKLAQVEFIEKNSSAGEWKMLKPDVIDQWKIKYPFSSQHISHELILNLKLTKFKHTGLFPEQQANWDFVANVVKSGDRFLNLFGYTGTVSLVAKACGAEVFHCDSVKQVIQWGQDNMRDSNLDGIHWVLEDAVKFAQREVKRANKYQCIIMDPPAFGIGANKERWKIEDKFADLLNLASQLIERGGDIIVNTYSPRLTDVEIRSVCNALPGNFKLEITKLAANTTSSKVLDYGELTRLKKI
ncbi:MAG: class I SAM-dependent methyltransferase [Crocinitomicaceae bacterium]|nr:class I SAM-dependent methyltransferase [Crocinitomicaceae bacterium]MBK8927129.1 class I SAM-dependent methyltransferase [Crocinitomicaceae bacterium]